MRQHEENSGVSLLVPIEDIYIVKGRGCVATGWLVRGQVAKGDTVEIVGHQQQCPLVVVEGVKEFIYQLEQHERSRINIYASILLEGVECNQVEPGMVLAAPGTLRPCNKFVAEILVISDDFGGRSRPFTAGYKPRLLLYNHPYNCSIALPDNAEGIEYEDRLEIIVTVDKLIALEKGTQFILDERYKVVGVGVVRELQD
jgi:elongation factor Tu